MILTSDVTEPNFRYKHNRRGMQVVLGVVVRCLKASGMGPFMWLSRLSNIQTFFFFRIAPNFNILKILDTFGACWVILLSP